MSVVAEVVHLLTARGETVGCAESLTGGLVVARLVDVPGASAAVRGGIVAYATPLKAALLGVDAEVLEARGAVDPDVARQMALGACRVLGTDWGVATTGVAGPDPQDGHPVGTVYVAVAHRPGGGGTASGGDGTTYGLRLALVGDRAQIRAAAVDAALGALLRELASVDVGRRE